MVMNVADALAAYRQGSGSGAAAKVGGLDAGGGESFADTLKGFAGDTVGALQEGEKAATSAATGKADLASVVTAISNAELMLQTVVTIRDKVIAAYQDITKTAI
jgi:flagellar hook-basal body complex protein FliE